MSPKYKLTQSSRTSSCASPNRATELKRIEYQLKNLHFTVLNHIHQKKCMEPFEVVNALKQLNMIITDNEKIEKVKKRLRNILLTINDNLMQFNRAVSVGEILLYSNDSSQGDGSLRFGGENCPSQNSTFAEVPSSPVSEITSRNLLPVLNNYSNISSKSMDLPVSELELTDRNFLSNESLRASSAHARNSRSASDKTDDILMKKSNSVVERTRNKQFKVHKRAKILCNNVKNEKKSEPNSYNFESFQSLNANHLCRDSDNDLNPSLHCEISMENPPKIDMSQDVSKLFGNISLHSRSNEDYIVYNDIDRLKNTSTTKKRKFEDTNDYNFPKDEISETQCSNIFTSKDYLFKNEPTSCSHNKESLMKTYHNNNREFSQNSYSNIQPQKHSYSQEEVISQSQIFEIIPETNNFKNNTNGILTNSCETDHKNLNISTERAYQSLMKHDNNGFMEKDHFYENKNSDDNYKKNQFDSEGIKYDNTISNQIYSTTHKDPSVIRISSLSEHEKKFDNKQNIQLDHNMMNMRQYPGYKKGIPQNYLKLHCLNANEGTINNLGQRNESNCSIVSKEISISQDIFQTELNESSRLDCDCSKHNQELENTDLLSSNMQIINGDIISNSSTVNTSVFNNSKSEDYQSLFSFSLEEIDREKLNKDLKMAAEECAETWRTLKDLLNESRNSDNNPDGNFIVSKSGSPDFPSGYEDCYIALQEMFPETKSELNSERYLNEKCKKIFFEEKINNAKEFHQIVTQFK